MIVHPQLATVAAFLPLISLHTLITTAAVINAGSASTSIVPLNATSLGLPFFPVDPRFKVETSYTNNPIDELSTLMVGVDTMAILATHDWIEDIPAFRSRPLPKYPSVTIEVKSELPDLDIPIRYTIWGLEIALQDYIARNAFHEAQFHLLYTDREVATIRFLNTPPAPPANSLSSSTNQTTTLSHELVDASQNSTLDVTYRPRVIIGYLPDAVLLDRGRVFLTIFATLGAVAVPRSTSISRDTFWIRSSPANDVEIGFSSRDGPHLPRVEPPELQYRSIIEAVREIPGWMLDHAFKEVDMRLYIGNTLVGRGNVDKVDPEESLSSSQVSTS